MTYGKRLVSLLVVATLAAGLAATAPAGAEERDAQPTQPRKAVAKPRTSRVEEGQDPTQVVVKFTEGTDIRVRDGGFVSPSGKHDVQEVNKAMASYRARLRLAYGQDEGRLDELRRRAQNRSGRAQADFNLYYHVGVPKGTDTAALLDKLNSQAIVELAHAAVPTIEAAHTFPTPDYTGSQGYTDAAPGGLDSDYANTLAGGDGTGVRIVDVERGWNFDHEDLNLAASTLISGAIRPASVEHGTAVLGEMVADDNGIGVKGMVPAASVRASSACRTLTADGQECATYSAAAAIVDATSHLLASSATGKVILLEQQTSGLYPVEIVQETYDAIVNAVDNGIVVVEAAANGTHDLDDYQDANGDYVLTRAFRDSGAIMVGGGSDPCMGCTDRSALWFTNWGSRVDVQGWGQNVVTTGYGGLYGVDAWANDPDRYYTSTFNGTSSASPTVTGAVAALQGRFIQMFGSPMNPWTLRGLLVDTGTAQPASDAAVKPIGPRPNLKGAIDNLWWWWLKSKILKFVEVYWVWDCPWCPPEWVPPVDIYYRDEVLIRYAIPGLSSVKQVETTLGRGTLTVRGERPATKTDYAHGARSSTVLFERTIPLPKGAQALSMRTSYVNGVFEVRMPMAT